MALGIVLLQGPRGRRFLMSEVPLLQWFFLPQSRQEARRTGSRELRTAAIQGYLAHKKTPTPLGPLRTLGIGLR